MTDRRLLLIPVDGPITVVDCPDLATMRRLIDAEDIERVRVGHDPEPGAPTGAGWALAIDSASLYRGKPTNARASALYGTVDHGVPICGPVLFGREQLAGAGPDIGIDWTDTDEAEAVAFMTPVFLATWGRVT